MVGRCSGILFIVHSVLRTGKLSIFVIFTDNNFKKLLRFKMMTNRIFWKAPRNNILSIYIYISEKTNICRKNLNTCARCILKTTALYHQSFEVILFYLAYTFSVQQGYYCYKTISLDCRNNLISPYPFQFLNIILSPVSLTIHMKKSLYLA